MTGFSVPGQLDSIKHTNLLKARRVLLVTASAINPRVGMQVCYSAMVL